MVLRSQLGDAMAEMVLQGMLPSAAVVGMMRAAAPSRPVAVARNCIWACFAAFFVRLNLLELPISGVELLSAVHRLLPKMLPEVRSKHCLKDLVSGMQLLFLLHCLLPRGFLRCSFPCQNDPISGMELLSAVHCLLPKVLPEVQCHLP